MTRITNAQLNKALNATEAKAAREMTKEIDAAVRVLEKLGDRFDKKRTKEFLKPAAKILISKISAAAPKSDSKHFRYTSSMSDKKKRAKKGEGNKVATYYPGNLARSIRMLTFRRSSDVWVGPRFAKRGSNGEYKGNKVDGFYARFVEFGTKHFAAQPFIRPSVIRAKTEVIKSIRNELVKDIAKFVAANKK